MRTPYICPPSVPDEPDKYGNVPSVPSGEVWLFDGGESWADPKYVISTLSTTEGVQRRFTGSSMNDSADWVAFNLPEGTVMTLMTHPTTPPEGQPFSLKDAGNCVDLIGNGEVQTVDLAAVSAVNCLSAFIWRKVNLSAGVFQLFNTKFEEGEVPTADTRGPRTTLFLSEWPLDTPNSLVGWAICDSADAIYFGGLVAQRVRLYDGAEGDGVSCGDYAGWFDDDNISANFNDSQFNNKAASWSWSLLEPVHSDVESVQVSCSPTSSLSSLRQTQTGKNTGDSTIKQIVHYRYEDSETLTCTTTSSVTTGYSQQVSMGYEYAGASFSITIGFAQSFTKTTQSTSSTTQTYSLSQSMEVNVPPNSEWNATWTVQPSKIAATTFETSGYYYYNQPVPGATLSESMSRVLGETVYCLEGTITGQISGGLFSESTTDVTTVPLA